MNTHTLTCLGPSFSQAMGSSTLLPTTLNGNTQNTGGQCGHCATTSHNRRLTARRPPQFRWKSIHGRRGLLQAAAASAPTGRHLSVSRTGHIKACPASLSPVSATLLLGTIRVSSVFQLTSLSSLNPSLGRTSSLKPLSSSGCRWKMTGKVSKTISD